MGLDTGLHADFGTVWDGAPNGIPYVCVSGTQKKVPVSFDYADESDPGPYPIPADAPIEGGPSSDGDRHVLVLDVDHQVLYELYDAYPQADGSWQAGSGAVFDLGSNAAAAGRLDVGRRRRPADPARPRALRRSGHQPASSTTPCASRWRARRRPTSTRRRHYASDSTDPDLPPMGLRVRLKADFDISGFSPEVRVILQALKTYGMMVADNGSNWYVSGAPDPRWSDDDLHELVAGQGQRLRGRRQPLPCSPGRSSSTRRRRRARCAKDRPSRATGSFVDEAGRRRGWTATVDYGGGRASSRSPCADHCFGLSHRYAVAGTYVVKVTVHGDGGTSGDDAVRARAVRNVAPRDRAAQRSGAARRGVAFRRRIAFTDPGADSWRTLVVWGDGTQTRRPIGRSHASGSATSSTATACSP